MRWNGEGWEKDTEAERAAAVAFAESEKNAAHRKRLR